MTSHGGGMTSHGGGMTSHGGGMTSSGVPLPNDDAQEIYAQHRRRQHVDEMKQHRKTDAALERQQVRMRMQVKSDQIRL